jgi:DUF4097 and DUF4098 domain-containing protein YvlB
MAGAILAMLAARPAAAHPSQGRSSGAEPSDRFSRRVRISPDGRVSLSNISGDIVVTATSGNEVSIEAVLRARDRGLLPTVHIDVEERGGSVFVHTTHTARNDRVSVDYTIAMPASAAIEVHSVSGNVKVTGVRGAARAETISGDVTMADTPKLEMAKSVSGNVTLSGVTTEGDLSAASVSGNLVGKSIKVHALDLGSVSGDVRLTDVSCDRLAAKSISGTVEYAGTITKGGSYEVNAHSGDIRLTLANPAGFVLNANSFSGSIRSDLPLTIGGDTSGAGRPGRRTGVSNHSMTATYGDGSATLTLRTFSGDIIISKR